MNAVTYTRLLSAALIAAAFALSAPAHAAPAEIQMLPPLNFAGTPCAGATGGILEWDGLSPVKCIPNTIGTASGFVGIGTLDPQYILDIDAPAFPTGSGARIYGSNFNGGVGLALQNNVAGGDSWSLVSEGGSSAPAGSFGIYDNGFPGERMVILKNGYVGINTPNPDYILDINVPFSPYGSAVRISGNNFNGGVGLVMQNNVAGGNSWSLVSEGGSSASAGYFGIYDNGLPGERLVISNKTGYVGIATLNPQYTLHVNGTAYATGAAGSLSDRRHKKDIQPLALDGIATVEKLRPVTFNWKDPKDDGMKGEQIGFIAQDLEEVLPQVVLTANDPDKTKALKYDELIPVLAKAVQELKVRNDSVADRQKADSITVQDLRRAFEAYKREHP